MPFWTVICCFAFYAGEELAYMMPVGTGDVKPVLEALIEDAEALGAKFRMLGGMCRDESRP